VRLGPTGGDLAADVDVVLDHDGYAGQRTELVALRPSYVETARLVEDVVAVR
jgi:hypothetical protein